jgi:hypothetical protein
MCGLELEECLTFDNGHGDAITGKLACWSISIVPIGNKGIAMQSHAPIKSEVYVARRSSSFVIGEIHG